MKLIDKDRVVAEIEKRKQEAINNCGGFKSIREHECDSCIVERYEEMEEILDTLEVKKVDLEKEIIKAEIEKCYNECLKRAKITDSDYWNDKADAYRNVLVLLDSVQEGPVSEDLEEEIKRYLHEVYDRDDTVSDVARHFAKWKEQQMMKEAVDGLVVCDELTHGYKDIAMHIPDNLEVGDKVKLIIIKED